jgi:hypothetical protein
MIFRRRRRRQLPHFLKDDRQEGNTILFLPLHIPDPLSTTRAAISSSSLILKYKLLLLLLKK